MAAHFHDDDSQLALLATHRRTIAHELRRAAAYGGVVAAPPEIAHSLAAARTVVAEIKAYLRARGVAVNDVLGDVAGPDENAPADHSAPAVAQQQHQQTMSGGVAGVLISGDFHGMLINQSPVPSSPEPIDADVLLASLPLDRVPEPAPLPPISRMRLPANPQFIGRTQDLLALAQVLKAGGVAAITTGIGGVGKTQLAAEVARRYGQYFAGGVFWLSFADPTGIDGEIAACGGAGALQLYTDASGYTQAEQVALVMRAWEEPTPRLLIFDNCDDTPDLLATQLLRKHLPTQGGCRVLVTSRRGMWPGLRVAQHPLQVLGRTASVALLREYRADLSDANADALADLLGDLPLALVLAGSYLALYQDERIGVPATYLANLRQQLLTHRSLTGSGEPISMTEHELSVRATFALSFDRLKPHDQADALAIAFLARAACLAPGEPIPRTLLLATLGNSAEDEAGESQRADALRRLVELGLLENAGIGALRMHRLLNAFALDVVTGEDAQAAVEQALINVGHGTVNAGFPVPLLSIAPHLRYVINTMDQHGDSRTAALAHVLGRVEQALTNYATARPLLERALAIREQALGAAHPDTATSLNNLAALLRDQGDYAAARPLLERALAIREQALGAAHPHTATSLNDLAALLRDQRDYAAARPLLERALAIYEQALGATHPHTATSLNNLAALLREQDDYAAARPLLERALAIYEQALGATHPDTAASVLNLAALLHDQRDYAAARPLYERALAIYEQALGATHPHTAISLWWLGSLLQTEGDSTRAQEHIANALAIFSDTLGPNHPTTQQCQRHLTSLAGPSPAVE